MLVNEIYGVLFANGLEKLSQEVVSAVTKSPVEKLEIDSKENFATIYYKDTEEPGYKIIDIKESRII